MSLSLSLSLRPLVVVLVCLGATAPAAAQGANPRVLRDACYTDAVALCRAVQPGGGRIFLCLDQNRAKLSDACKAALPSSEAIKARFGG